MHRFKQLEELAKKDSVLRNDLLQKGELFEGYHPAMESLHIENGHQLQKLVDLYGWPEIATDGKAATNAAFIIFIHAISLPDLQRNMLTIFKKKP